MEARFSPGSGCELLQGLFRQIIRPCAEARGRSPAAMVAGKLRSATSMTVLTPAEAARIVRASIQTLAHWRSRGIGPRYLKPNGRAILYPAEWLEQWLLETEGGKRNGTARTRRKMELAVHVGRTGILGGERLGRHQTQRDRRAGHGDGAPPRDRGGPLPQPAAEGEEIQ